MRNTKTKSLPARRSQAQRKLTRIHANCEKQKRRNKARGWLVAGASLAALFGFAYIKGQADTQHEKEN